MSNAEMNNVRLIYLEKSYLCEAEEIQVNFVEIITV